MILGNNKDEKKIISYIKMGIAFLSSHIILDPRYLNDYCPYCFKTKNGKSIFEDSENNYKTPSLKDLREKYLAEISSVINKSMIEDEYDLKKYYLKECSHTFHEDCKKKVDKHICYFCKYSLCEQNSIIFDEYIQIPEEKRKILKKNNFVNILSKFFNDEIRLKVQILKGNVTYEKMLLDSINFFLQNNNLIIEEIRKKYSERKKLCNELRKLNLEKYNFKSIKLNDENFNKLKNEYELIIEKKREEEREKERERIRREMEEDEEEENDDDDDDNRAFNYNYNSHNYDESVHSDYRSTQPRRKFLSEIRDRFTYRTCKQCQNSCVNCGTNKSIGLTTLYVHKECYPRRARERRCYICGAEKVPINPVNSRICNKCMRDLKSPNSYCLVCYGKFT